MVELMEILLIVITAEISGVQVVEKPGVQMAAHASVWTQPGLTSSIKSASLNCATPNARARSAFAPG